MTQRLPDAEYHSLCLQVLRRDGWKCRSCGLRSTLSVHHIVFRSQGGLDESSNILTLCLACHNGLHVDVQDGMFGLTLLPNVGDKIDANLGLVCVRQPWWRPT